MNEPRSHLRCAIYTRKSTEEGLEQEFNSLDAQRESAEAYIGSQRQRGWTALAGAYDDGGFSGASWSGRRCGDCSPRLKRDDRLRGRLQGGSSQPVIV